MNRFDALFYTSTPITVVARDLSETWALGRELGQGLTAGTVLCLWGTLGSGKTSFVQGVARGLGVSENEYVTSPSYTLINEYQGRLSLYHLDLYRLGDSEELWEIGVDEILSAGGVVAVEWPDKLPQGLVTDYLKVDIAITPNDTRSFTFTPLGLDLKK